MVERKPVVEKRCLACGNSFATTRKNHILCSSLCRWNYKTQKNHELQIAVKVKMVEGNFIKNFPEIAAEANGWDASVSNPKSSDSMSWKCEMGHVYKATIASKKLTMNSKFKGCPICSNQRILKGVNDLATTHPIAQQFSKKLPGQFLRHRKFRCISLVETA